MSFYEICGFMLSILLLCIIFIVKKNNDIEKKHYIILGILGIPCAIMAYSVFIVGVAKIIFNQ